MLRHIVSWKYVIAVAVVLGCSIYVSREDQKTRDQYQQKCTQLNASTVSLPAHEDCDKGSEDAARQLPRWYRVFGWPEGITTLAILLTLLAIADQTAQTRKAAEAAKESVIATRDSVLLQEKALEQWLVIDNWKAEIGSPLLDDKYLFIQVDIVNRTQYPITINEGVLAFIIRGGGGQDTYIFTEHTFLPPGVPHEVSVLVEITENQAAAFATSPLLVTVFGSFIHIGALRRPTIQKLWGELSCAEFGVTFTAKLHPNPKKATEDQQIWD
jgi:hypothetical protein